MIRRLALGAVLAAAFVLPAHAALKVGDTAPDFSAPASQAGKQFPFDLAKALKKGPVVLYFFPAAFTQGCTIEAHEFADASDEYKKLGATLIGVTAGNINRLTEFSVSECRSKFPVAADPDAKIAAEYKSTLAIYPGHSDRTSYVIAPDGKVIFVYSNLNPDQHVTKTLDAVKAWRAQHPA
ncbi:MAG: peroxiredoxin [Alphaproteobacteria bacterium]|jgi:peroxiredoxin|nr:peroxiredoxin [Alphaproteobacteria bacterium]